MVVLNKIYTRTGDKGDTALGNGDRVAKHSARVTAYGTVDETNATVGLARLHATGDMADWPPFKTICLIWAQIFAAPTWKKTPKLNTTHYASHLCRWPVWKLKLM